MINILTTRKHMYMYLHAHTIFYSFNILDSGEEARVSTAQILHKCGDQGSLIIKMGDEIKKKKIKARIKLNV